MRFSQVKSLTFCFLIAFVTTANAQAKSTSFQKNVLSDLTLANGYFMKKWPDPGKKINAKGNEWVSHIWTRAVYYEGLSALYRIDPRPAYYKYMVEWGEKHEWKVCGERLTRNADNQCCGQTYLDLYSIEKDPRRIENIKLSIDNMMSTSKVDDWNWIDAIQMAMPVFAKLGMLYQDTSYFNRMYEMYAFTKYKHGGKGLYNPAEQLWWRDKDFVPPYQEPNGKNCYWARGNGWVLAALVRVLQTIPPTETHYQEYLGDFKAMCRALVPLQRKDGFWNVSLMDPTNFGGKELTGTSLFVYGLAYGINNGLLDRKTYFPATIKAWKAITKDCIHKNGFLGYVQGTGKEPKDSQPVGYDLTPDFEDFGLGCFLLAGSEVYKF